MAAPLSQTRMSWEQGVTARLGQIGLRNLVADFYKRIRTDDLIGKMYPPDDWEGSEQRLADFICFRIAGNPVYMETRGHPRLRMRHAPFRIGEAERDRWILLMGESMDAQGIDGEERAALDAFFLQVADFMRNQAG
jgi:Truncated hemoglobins